MNVHVGPPLMRSRKVKAVPLPKLTAKAGKRAGLMPWGTLCAPASVSVPVSVTVPAFTPASGALPADASRQGRKACRPHALGDFVCAGICVRFMSSRAGVASAVSHRRLFDNGGKQEPFAPEFERCSTCREKKANVSSKCPEPFELN